MKKIFFTGHQNAVLGSDERQYIFRLLIEYVSEGTVDFYAGGAKGGDMLFENMVLIVREHYPMTKLHLVLPCPPEEQTAKWSKSDKEEYMRLLNAADSVEIVSEHYGKDCMKKRNERLVELGDVCLCYYNERRRRSGTGQTVRLARISGRKVINICQKYATK